MKQACKRILSVMLSMVILVSVFALMGIEAVAAEKTEVKEGDLITFGSYPQTEVKDKNILDQLNKLTLNWQSYGYYSGDYEGPEGDAYFYEEWVSHDTMKPSDYMKYADITYNGEKYRAVTFTELRPNDTVYSFSIGDEYQSKNGYIKGNVYWFKYEPLQWRVLDPENGLILCESVIDSQAFNNTTYKKEPVGNPDPTFYRDNYDYYSDPKYTYYSNDYAHSSIRAWLNDDFYNTAFDSSDKIKITETICENRSVESYEFEIKNPDKSIPPFDFDAEETKDNVFLLSYKEVVFGELEDGVLSDSEFEKWVYVTPTDYAKCQGVATQSYNGYDVAVWIFRSAVNHSNKCFVLAGSSSENVTRTLFGIRPAMRITEFGETVTPDIDDKEEIVEVADFNLNYKGSTKIPVTVKADNYTITYSSSDESVATVNEEGNVTAVGTGEAEITVTVYDNYGNEYTETCKVTVTYAWWQWIVIIVLFGWIWY